MVLKTKLNQVLKNNIIPSTLESMILGFSLFEIEKASLSEFCDEDSDS